MINTQKYIQQHGLDSLIQKYSLVARYSKKYPNLVQLCYHQLDTPKNEITNECRGLILDIDDNFKVVSYPFYRFSDYSDKSVLDKESSVFYEKIDGSIITMYRYNNEWLVSTKTVPDADGKILNKDTTFNEYFWKVFNSKYDLPVNTNCNYSFEFSFPDQGITSKKEEDISLLMVRDLTTMQELNIQNFSELNPVKPIDITFELVEKYLRTVDPIVSEGFVVCDKNYNRYKMKSPQFERISELKINYNDTEERQVLIDKDNFRKLCDIVRTNNHSTFLTEKYLSVRNQYHKISKQYKKLLNDTQRFVDTLENKQGKELGLFLKNKPKYLNTLAFGISQNRIDKNSDTYLEDYFFNMNIKMFEEIIKTI